MGLSRIKGAGDYQSRSARGKGGGVEEAGGACWLGKRRRELVLRASRLIHVRLVWVSAVLDPSRTSTTMLWSPSPLRSPSYVFLTGQVAASPLTWPHIQPQRCLSTCGLGGVTCSWCKKGPAAQTLQRQNKSQDQRTPSYDEPSPRNTPVGNRHRDALLARRIGLYRPSQKLPP